MSPSAFFFWVRFRKLSIECQCDRQSFVQLGQLGSGERPDELREILLP